jgi:hypothetical protein
MRASEVQVVPIAGAPTRRWLRRRLTPREHERQECARDVCALCARGVPIHAMIRDLSTQIHHVDCEPCAAEAILLRGEALRRTAARSERRVRRLAALLDAPRRSIIGEISAPTLRSLLRAGSLMPVLRELRRQ